MKNRLTETFSQKEQRTFVLFFFFFQINLLAELKIQSTSALHYLMITQKRCFCAEGDGNGNPLQYSCLENPRNREAWWAAVYGVAQSRTRLKRLSSSSSEERGPYFRWNKLFFFFFQLRARYWVQMNIRIQEKTEITPPSSAVLRAPLAISTS